MKGKRPKPVHFEDVAERSLRLIDSTLADLEKLRRHNRAQMDDGDAPNLNVAGLNALTKTTTALSGLLAQLRQISKDNQQRMGDIGPSERMRLMLDYFATLPEEQMYLYLLDFKSLYDERRSRHATEETHRQMVASAAASIPDSSKH